MDERKLKEMAEQESKCANGTIGGGAIQGMSLGDAKQDARQDSLRDRIHSQLRRAQKDAYKANALGELEYLLDKNPETARIFELMEQVGR